MGQEELLQLGYKRVDLPLSVGSYEVKDEQTQAFAFTDSNINYDPDLQYIRFILCHEGTNANGDTFTKEVLQGAQSTPKYKPVNWEHGQPVVGTMLDAVYQEDASGVGYVEAVGVVWKFIYPQLAEQIKAKSATGELKLSMECYYKDANYLVGDTLYTSEEADNLGLIDYVGRVYMGKAVKRVFKEVIFGGVGVVANPADQQAVFLAVAKDLQAQNHASADLTHPTNDFTAKVPKQDTQNAMVVAKYVKAFDKAKSAVVSQLNQEELQAKEQMTAQVQDILRTFLTEIASIQGIYMIGVAEKSVADMSQDAVENSLEFKLSQYYLSINDGYEIDIEDIYDDFFIFELTNYNPGYEEDNTLYKGFYSVVNDEVVLYLDQLVEVEKVYQEVIAGQIVNESEEQPLEEEQKVEAAEAVETKEETVEVAEIVQVDDKAQATQLEKEVAELKKQLEAKASLEAELNALKARFAEMEADKLVQARLVELKEAGIEFSESRLAKEQAKLKAMDAESYADYKELLLEVTQNKAQAEEVAQASEQEVTVDVEIEKSGVALAAINIEQEEFKEAKPFGHLSK